MIKTKYLLYAFKLKNKKNYNYWAITDNKYFRINRPPLSILKKRQDEFIELKREDIIDNPWNKWDTDDIQKIITDDGVCINYLKSTDGDLIQIEEDLKLLEKYSDIVERFDISKPFGFDIIKRWHEEIFESIYPFAGDIRTVEMSKGNGSEAWTWRLEFLSSIPDLDTSIKDITKNEYEDVDGISRDLSKMICDFLFIHPFREGNGRISRLLCDVILAKNNFPMIGLKLKKEDNYIQRVHAGYDCDYKPMEELLKMKITEEIMHG